MDRIEQGSSDINLGAHQDHGFGVNYYRVLDIDPGATRIEVREAYLRLKSTYGAGSAALYSLISEEEAGEQMALVEEAFRVLNDEIQRREYDQKIGLVRATGRQGAALGDFDAVSAPVDEVGLHTERLLFAREQAEGNHPDTSADPTIRTARSALPIIKLKANRAGSEEMLVRLQELMATGDLGDGDLYKRMRECCEVTEDEICERTKVSIGYIRAIEANRFDRLPQAVYVKGFLRSYFRYLGVLDSEKLVAAFSARLMDWQASRKS